MDRNKNVSKTVDLCKAAGTGGDLRKAYGSLKRAYAHRELELLELVKLMSSRLDDPNVRAIVVAYAGRIGLDPNFAEAMQSSAVVERKLGGSTPSAPGMSEAHEAMALVFAARPMGEEPVVLDLNLLQHAPTDATSKRSQKEASKLLRRQSRLPKVEPTGNRRTFDAEIGKRRTQGVPLFSVSVPSKTQAYVPSRKIGPPPTS